MPRPYGARRGAAARCQAPVLPVLPVFPFSPLLPFSVLTPFQPSALPDFMIKWIVLAVFLGAVLRVHLRGRVRHSLFRQLFDHSAFLAPLNTLMYALSAVPVRPYVPVSAFPDLLAVQARWQDIRNEALALVKLQKDRRAHV